MTSCWIRQNDGVPSGDQDYAAPYDKEPMFEKPLTPSDVGKLNRLVIPKQHAEKHFPLGGFAGAGDGAETLLGFEDEAGKPWRFRYSYWNSSQSYVLTKGWSRYVKEKRLDAGDVVFFERHRADHHRLFIGWRRRGAAPATTVFAYNAQAYPPAHDSRRAPPVAVGRAEAATGGGGGSNGRRQVRLFGVNLECQQENNVNPRATQTTSFEGEGTNLVSITQQQGNGYYFDYNAHHMEMNFPQGVNWMGNGLG